MGIRLHVWGDYACFTRPEMKVERVSYDVITPSAARGILEAIYWKPSIVWRIDKIWVLKPIQFIQIRRNEVGSKMSPRSECLFIEDERQQRSSLVLRDVGYVIGAHFEMTQLAGKDDPSDAHPQKHLEVFIRRAKKGQTFHQPYLGTREFPAYFRLLEENEMPEISLPEHERNKDLGWMLYDINFDDNHTPGFFRARMNNGIIDVPPYEEIFHDSRKTV